MDDDGQNGECNSKRLHLSVRQTKTLLLQMRKLSPNPDIPEGVLQMGTKKDQRKSTFMLGNLTIGKKKSCSSTGQTSRFMLTINLLL
jgi:hypothetical protein